MSTSIPPAQRNTDEVGILQIHLTSSVTNNNIYYYLILVDLPESDNLKFTFDRNSYDNTTETLNIAFRYEGTNPPPGTPLKTYVAGLWAFQNDAQSNPITLRHVEVSGTENGNPVSKGGTYASIKIKGDDIDPILTVNADALSLDNPQTAVIQSASNSACYVVLSWAKTVQANSLLLQLTADTTDAKKLNGAYQPNAGQFNNPNANNVAVGAVNSTNGQYTKVTIGSKTTTIANGEHTYTNPIVL